MRVAEKLAIIDRVARVLQARYTYSEIDVYLAEFGVETPDNFGINSKWVYSKEALKGVNSSTIAKIVEDLDLGSTMAVAAAHLPPHNWTKAKEFRLFISHIAKDKDKATRLKACLKQYGISGFVAHEDIHPTLEWQREIERALYCMDAMVTIHTVGFSQSFWTQQEIGFAIGRGTKVISLRMGEDPTGFISKQQALSRGRRRAEEIAQEVDKLLEDDERTRDKLLAARSNGDEIPF